MINGHILKRRKLLLLWLMSYIAILLISIVTSFGIYLEAGRIIEGEISRANISMLDQARQTMDNRMMDIERLAMQIAFNPRVLNTIRVKGDFGPKDQLNLYRTVEDLRHYMVSSGFVSSIYIFLHDTDSIITSSTYIDSGIFFDFTFGGGKTSFEEWKYSMKDSHRSNYLVFYGENSVGQPRRMIVHAQSIPIESIRNPLATIAIIIDESKFANVIRDVKWIDQGYAFIISDEGRIVATSRDTIERDVLEQLSDEFRAMEENKSGIFYSRLNDEISVITYSASQVADWKYVSIIPYSVFWEKAGHLRYLAWIGVLLTVFIGGAGSYLLARKNYSPVEKIVRNLNGKSKTSILGVNNEYQFIQENISLMIAENEKISKRLEDQNVTLKDNFLLKLLKGKLDGSTNDTQDFSTYGINFHANHFAVILLNVERDLALCPDDSMPFDLGTLKQAGFVAARSVEELISMKSQSILLEEEQGMIALIVNFKEDDPESNHVYIKEVMQEAKSFVTRNFGITFTAAVSNIYEGSPSISFAYHEALEAMEYRAVSGIGEIICYRDIKRSKCSDYHYSLDTEQKFTNCIKTGDFEKTTSVLMSIFTDNLSKDAFSPDMAKCLMFDIVSTIMKTAEDMNDASFLEELQPVKRLSECRTIMEMKYALADILKRVCGYYEISKSGKNDMISGRVKAYIAHNYVDMNLGVSMIGEKFSLTPSYISKLFKEQTKESLPDYINKVRIDMAIQLLREDNATIFDVAQKVGYCNSNVFIRAFKKYQGITPGRFKDMKESS